MITWILRCEIIDTYLSIINRYLSISIILLRFKPFLAALHSKYEYPLAFSDFIFVQCKNCSNCIFLGFQPRSWCLLFYWTLLCVPSIVFILIEPLLLLIQNLMAFANVTTCPLTTSCAILTFPGEYCIYLQFCVCREKQSGLV